MKTVEHITPKQNLIGRNTDRRTKQLEYATKTRIELSKTTKYTIQKHDFSLTSSEELHKV